MATIVQPTIRAITRGAYVITWTFASGVFASGDVGVPFDGVMLPDKTVQVHGFVASGTSNIIIEGTNHLSTTVASGIATGPWDTLNDPQGNALTYTATSRVETILENPRFIRPRVNTATTTPPTLIVEITAQSGRR